MPNLVYVSGTGRQAIELDALPVHVGTANDLRGREWDYSLRYRSITGVNRPAREVTMDAWILQRTEADRMRRIFDRDVACGTPGTFVAYGKWEQRGYVTAMDARGIYADTLAQRLTVVLLDGVWRKENIAHFDPEADDPGEEYGYLDYTHDYAYDYSENAKPDSITASDYVPSAVKLVIFGPVTDPTVTIGGNLYQVDVTVPSGGYLLVDGLAKTVALVTANGTVTNVFDKATRGTGEGGGSYIFQPLPVGESSVTWDRTFGFDVHYYDEEGEPPWASATA